MQQDRHAIVTSGLTKTFGALRAVDNLSFSVPRGSIFGFLGPNGAGKTTTFALLCGFIRPSSGGATILGQSLKDFRRDEGRMSALPQDARFHPDRSVIDSLRFLAELQGLSTEKARIETDRVLSAVDLLDARKKRGGELSHGMSKRFGIAQAFLGTPEMVLLDEPTEGLDPRNARTIRDMVRQLSGKSTVLVSSHNLSEVQDLCDYAAIIDHGKLVTQGSIAQLTHSDEQIILTLGSPCSFAVDALAQLAGVKTVDVSDDGLKLKVAFALDLNETTETAITRIMKAALEAGAMVGSVVRGKSLEDRFLEVT